MTIRNLPYRGWALALGARRRKLVWKAVRAGPWNPARGAKRNLTPNAPLFEPVAAWFDEGTHRLTSPGALDAAAWFGRTEDMECVVLSFDFPGLAPSLKLPAPERTRLERQKFLLQAPATPQDFFNLVIGNEVEVGEVDQVAIAEVGEHAPYFGWSEQGFPSGGDGSVDAMTSSLFAITGESVWVYASGVRNITDHPIFEKERLVFQVEFAQQALLSALTYRKSNDARVKTARTLAEFKTAIFNRVATGSTVYATTWGTVRYVKRSVWLSWLPV